MLLDPCRLTVHDVGFPPKGREFNAVIGSPPTIRLAIHRDAGYVDLLGPDQPDPQREYWETRTYALLTAGEGWAFYEPEGWQTFTEADIEARKHIANSAQMRPRRD